MPRTGDERRMGKVKYEELEVAKSQVQEWEDGKS
jgi:hypothetical protein